MRNIIKHDERCIKLLYFMLPVGKSKNYYRSYEFRQIIGPLNKHSQNKQNVCKILKLTFLKLISRTTVFLVSIMLKLQIVHGIKGNNSFRV